MPPVRPNPSREPGLQDCFRINGDLDDIADDDSAFTSEALQLKLFVCGYQHQERRRLANVHSGSGTVPKRIRDLERPSRDEE